MRKKPNGMKAKWESPAFSRKNLKEDGNPVIKIKELSSGAGDLSIDWDLIATGYASASTVNSSEPERQYFGIHCGCQNRRQRRGVWRLFQRKEQTAIPDCPGQFCQLFRAWNPWAAGCLKPTSDSGAAVVGDRQYRGQGIHQFRFAGDEQRGSGPGVRQDDHHSKGLSGQFPGDHHQ
jgi:hypothetical protein